MSLQFFHEDGKGNAMDEDGNEPIHMQVDEMVYTLDNITTDFDSSYSALKPPVKAVKPKRVAFLRLLAKYVAETISKRCFSFIRCMKKA